MRPLSHLLLMNWKVLMASMRENRTTKGVLEQAPWSMCKVDSQSPSQQSNPVGEACLFVVVSTLCLDVCKCRGPSSSEAGAHMCLLGRWYTEGLERIHCMWGLYGWVPGTLQNWERISHPKHSWKSGCGKNSHMPRAKQNGAFFFF